MMNKKLPCICKGNWRNILHEARPLIHKKFSEKHTSKEFIFMGVMDGVDDYYYVMWSKEETKLLSCVGSIEMHGYERTLFSLIEDARDE